MTTANLNVRVFWAGLLLILAAFTVTAQEFRGSLAGKITDPNGAVVPGSKVEIKNVETGIVSSTTTGEDGSYNFALLPPGKYQLTVTKENFNTAIREGAGATRPAIQPNGPTTTAWFSKDSNTSGAGPQIYATSTSSSATWTTSSTTTARSAPTRSTNTT